METLHEQEPFLHLHFKNMKDRALSNPMHQTIAAAWDCFLMIRGGLQQEGIGIAASG